MDDNDILNQISGVLEDWRNGRAPADLALRRIARLMERDEAVRSFDETYQKPLG